MSELQWAQRLWSGSGLTASTRTAVRPAGESEGVERWLSGALLLGFPLYVLSLSLVAEVLPLR